MQDVTVIGIRCDDESLLVDCVSDLLGRHFGLVVDGNESSAREEITEAVSAASLLASTGLSDLAEEIGKTALVIYVLNMSASLGDALSQELPDAEVQRIKISRETQARDAAAQIAERALPGSPSQKEPAEGYS